MQLSSNRYTCFVKKLQRTNTFLRRIGSDPDEFARLNPALARSLFVPGGSLLTLELSPLLADQLKSAPDLTLGHGVIGAFGVVDPQWYPPRPSFGPADREATFGRFDFVDDPSPTEPDGIRITGTWARDNLGTVTIPELVGVAGASSTGQITFFRGAHAQLRGLFAAWKAAGLRNRITTWNGAFNPRYMRRALHVRRNLSNHAWGTAFDINAARNPLGHAPAAWGRPGCVYELVEIAHEFGFYWGGRFRGSRPDGMHFEVARLL